MASAEEDGAVFGKSIGRVTKDDLDRLIHDGVSEGRHLEFKVDFPGNSAKPAWTPGKPIERTRLCALIEELVAFANADGGVIVLGMKESDGRHHQAEELRPLQQVVQLARSIRDSLKDLIEPRLPYASVVPIELATDGSGVLLLETQASTLGPHWVSTTRTAKVRREDRSDPLSMPEIHDMVLRNARRFNEVEARLEKATAEFEPFFFQALDRMCKHKMGSLADLPMRPVEAYRQWISRAPHTLLGLRVTLVPHQRLGITRLEDMKGLIAGGQIDELRQDTVGSAIALLYDHDFGSRRVLGGMVSAMRHNERQATLHVTRDGVVELKFVWQEPGELPFPHWVLLGGAGSALGCYQCLRELAGSPSMPAEIGVELITMPGSRPAFGHDVNVFQGQPLEFKTHFPIATIADTLDFDEYLNELAGDFANAGGMATTQLPRYRLALRMPNQP